MTSAFALDTSTAVCARCSSRMKELRLLHAVTLFAPSQHETNLPVPRIYIVYSPVTGREVHSNCIKMSIGHSRSHNCTRRRQRLELSHRSYSTGSDLSTALRHFRVPRTESTLRHAMAQLHSTATSVSGDHTASTSTKLRVSLDQHQLHPSSSRSGFVTELRKCQEQDSSSTDEHVTTAPHWLRVLWPQPYL